MKKIIVVLGMHRSGTSLLTKSLEVIGVELGKEAIACADDNPKGFWENKDVQSLNDEILEFIGISWFDVKHIPETIWKEEFWSSQINRAMVLLTDKIADVNVWGFKDPRTCLTIPFWEMVFSKLELEVKYIVSIRSYESVATSLEVRNNITKNYSYALWFLYTYNALTNSKHKKIIIRYEDLLINPCENIKKMSIFCNQKLDGTKLEEYTNKYVDPSLDHSPESQTSLSTPVQHLCEKLDEVIRNKQNELQENVISVNLTKKLNIIYSDYLLLISELKRYSAVKVNHYDLDLVPMLKMEVDKLTQKNLELNSKLMLENSALRSELNEGLSLFKTSFLFRLERKIINFLKNRFHPQ